jgi:SAM-dependent methyltransferase
MTVPPARTRFDPRRHTLASVVGPVDTVASDFALGQRVAEVLAGERNLVALRAATALLPAPGGMSYAPDVLAARATRRVSAALRAAARFGRGEFVSVLDLGCSRGDNLIGLDGQERYDYVGLDIDPSRFPSDTSQPPSRSARFLTGSATAIPLPAASVDLVVSFNVLEHIQGLGAALPEIARVLRPGGVFFSQFGPPWNAPFGPHHRRFSGLAHMHHLFADDVVAAFIGRGYVGLNREPLAFYRRLLWDTAQLECAHYVEHFTIDWAWLWPHFMAEHQALSLDERCVNRIDVALVRSGAP